MAGSTLASPTADPAIVGIGIGRAYVETIRIPAIAELVAASLAAEQPVA